MGRSEEQYHREAIASLGKREHLYGSMPSPSEVLSGGSNSERQRSILARAQADAAMASARGLMNSSAVIKAQIDAARASVYTDSNQLLTSMVHSISMHLTRKGGIEIGGGVSVTSISTQRDTGSMEDTLRFHLVQPDGVGKVFKGPLYAFRGCTNIKEIVLRALEYGKERKGELICYCCKEADKNCYLTCTKGRRIDPDKVYVINWRKV